MIKKILFFIGLAFVLYFSFTTINGSDDYHSIYVKDCRMNIGKYVVICGKEYKIIDYYTTDDTYLLDNREKIKADFINGYIFVK